MRRLAKIVICAALSAILFTPYLAADVIHLKNGGKIKGIVLEDNGDIVVIDIGGGTVTHNKKDIYNIERDFVKRDVAHSHIRAPRPKSKLTKVFDDLVSAAGSILRLEFLKKSK